VRRPADKTEMNLNEKENQAEMVGMRRAELSPKNCEIGFITVNYKSAKATALLLADLLQQNSSHADLTVVVADNSPSESELDSVRQAYCDCPCVRFERMPGNLGYFGAAHLALNTVWKDRLPDWVIVSNTDVRLPQSDFFSRIAELPARTGVVAPRIVSGRTGLDQNPFLRRRPSGFRLMLTRCILRVAFLHWLFEAQAFLKRAIRRRLRGRRQQSAANPIKIYAPHGSFILFSNEYFRRGGSLNCGAFLYAEEIFVAEICRRIGVEVTYQPSLDVLHDEHVSTRDNPAVRRFQHEAAEYYHQEFFSKVSR
jgi:GT2 family glycosyltransferase